MPNIDLIKLKIRRGTDAQRNLIVLDQGELGYTVDTKRVFVGDSATTGGIPVGNKVFQPTTTKTALTGCVIGDTILENSLYYQLTGNNPSNTNSWVLLSTKPDNLTIRFTPTNTLTVVPSGFSSSMADALADNTTTQQLGGKLSVKTLFLSSAAASTVNNGLSVSTTGVGINADPDYFAFNGSQLTLQQITIPNSKFLLSANGQYFDTSADVLDFTPFTVPNNDISIDPSFFSVSVAFSANNTTFADNLSVFSSNTAGRNLSAGFVGNLATGIRSQTTSVVLSAVNITEGSGTTVISLSSAGFMTLSRNISGNGLPGRRIAIPIYTY